MIRISGEDEFAGASNLPADRFAIRKMGLGFVGILGDTLPIEKHRAAARKALDMFVEEKNSGHWHLIVLDEVNVAISLGLLTVNEVIAAIKDYSDNRILILSGRGATQELIDIADLATEMREIKHPFAQGGKSIPTVEF